MRCGIVKVRTVMPSSRQGILSFLVIAFLLATAIPASSQQPSPAHSSTFSESFDLAFPDGDPLRNIIKPIFLGEDSFTARLRAQTAQTTQTSQTSSGRTPLGLVLCGGSARAYAHIGVLRALEEANIYPDFIVASSMGAIVGMLYAAGFSPDDIQLLIRALPLESYFNVVIPTNGGLINVDTFRAVVRAIVGDIDISRTAIPIIVTAEDLKSRRQIWIAQGPFDRAMTSAFAMPAIIEPQSFARLKLIDAGVATIAPVEPALKFSDRLIISTAFYDRIKNFSNPLTVLNRAVDIGKTRSGMRQIEKSNAFVIRNDVENLSYMQFSEPEIIIDKGEESARAALNKLSPDMRSLLENHPGDDFFAQRHFVHENLLQNLQQLRSGFMPSSSFTLRGVPVFKPFRSFLSSVGETGTEPRIGASCAINIAKMHASIGYFAAIESEPDKNWALESTFEANPTGGLNMRFTGRLWGTYGAKYILEHNPTYWEISALAQDIASRGNTKLGFKVGGKALLDMGGALTEWKSSALIHSSLFRDFSMSGPRVFPWYSIDAGGFLENSTKSQISCGVEGTLMAGLESLWVSPGLRASAKISLNDQEYAQDAYDGFRSNAPREDALASLITNTEIDFAPQNLYFDFAESLLLRKFKLGPFFDTRWNSAAGQSFRMCDWAAGASFSFEARAFGLAPASMSLFASYSGSKVFSLQFRAGVLISPQ